MKSMHPSRNPIIPESNNPPIHSTIIPVDFNAVPDHWPKDVTWLTPQQVDDAQTLDIGHRTLDSLLNGALKNLRLAQVLVKTAESRQALVECGLAVKCVLYAEKPSPEPKPIHHCRE